MSAQQVDLTAAEHEDLVDEALVRAADKAALPGKIGAQKVSPFATAARLSTNWMADAACSAAPPGDVDQLTEARSGSEGAGVIETYCAGCPVVEQCLFDGRALRSYGVLAAWS